MADEIKATPSRRRTVKVNVKVGNTGQISESGPPVTVQSVPSKGRLDELRDVDATTEIEGGVPRYDSATDEYKVEKLTYNDLLGAPAATEITEIDGGSF
jgi:hypothetical protein